LIAVDVIDPKRWVHRDVSAWLASEPRLCENRSNGAGGYACASAEVRRARFFPLRASVLREVWV